MLTDAELSEMRAVQGSALPDVCDVVTTAQTGTTYLTRAETETVVASGVECRVARAGGREDGGGGSKLTATGNLILTVPAGTPVSTGAVVRVTSRTPVMVLQVTSGPLSSWNTADRWAVSEVK